MNSLQEARRLTNLQSYSVEDVFEAFAEAADDEGLLSRQAFNSVFRKLIKAGGAIADADKPRIEGVVDRLFETFDADGNGVVDFSELASGLSVLCGGSREDKVEAAFALYDLDGDGTISLDEMTTYLTSVFKVMYETQPGTAERMGVSAEELAEDYQLPLETVAAELVALGVTELVGAARVPEGTIAGGAVGPSVTFEHGSTAVG